MLPGSGGVNVRKTARSDGNNRGPLHQTFQLWSEVDGHRHLPFPVSCCTETLVPDVF